MHQEVSSHKGQQLGEWNSSVEKVSMYTWCKVKWNKYPFPRCGSRVRLIQRNKYVILKHIQILVPTSRVGAFLLLFPCWVCNPTTATLSQPGKCNRLGRRAGREGRAGVNAFTVQVIPLMPRRQLLKNWGFAAGCWCWDRRCFEGSLLGHQRSCAAWISYKTTQWTCIHDKSKTTVGSSNLFLVSFVSDPWLSLQNKAWEHRDFGRYLREHNPLLPGHAAVSTSRAVLCRPQRKQEAGAGQGTASQHSPVWICGFYRECLLVTGAPQVKPGESAGSEPRRVLLLKELLC